MVIQGEIHKNTYCDSVALMRIANAVAQRRGVARVEVLVATPTNLDALRADGLFAPDSAGASANDIIATVEADSQEVAREALASIREMLRTTRATEVAAPCAVFSIQTALQRRPDANLVLFSIPGPFVKRQGIRALRAGLNLFIFSDNVPVEDEIELKQVAEVRNLLVMGPDCGTAIISGVGLGFANRVRRGNIGLVAASGTGLQEVTCLIHGSGLGISHAIGTGTNDVKAVVGGVTFIRGLRMLEADSGTTVIVIITKPPDRAIAERILAVVRQCKKAVVMSILGEDLGAVRAVGAIPAVTLEDAARAAVQVAGGVFRMDGGDWHCLVPEWEKLAPTQKYVRGVFSGGTFTAEAGLVLAGRLGGVSTNTGIREGRELANARLSVGHTCVDLGADEFTRGRPHPMLEPFARHQRILQEVDDPETAVLLVDVVLGLGVHPDPAGILANTVALARERATARGRYLPVVASVCGTDDDPQDRSKQVSALRAAGALVFGSNAEAARAAACIALRTPGQARGNA